MRIIFMGTPQIAATILSGLIQDEDDIVAVVTQPDKQKGRGKQVAYSEVKEVALEHGLNVLQPVRARNEDFISTIRDLKPDMIVVTAFGQILSQELLDIPPLGCINVHASLLPKYRGAAPIQQAILQGEEKTGVTIMRMDSGIDTGDMILKEEVIIEAQETGKSLTDKLAVAGLHALRKAILLIKANKAVYEKQEESQSCYAQRLTKDMGHLDFTRPAAELERYVRGLNPWPSAYAVLDHKTLKIWSAKVHEDDNLEGNPGEVIEVKKDSFFIQTQKGQLEVLQVQLEGKKSMTVGEFLRGYSLKKGTVLQ